MQVLQQIATDYPDSPLATYANQALGNSYAFLENYQEALPFLKAAQQNPVGLYDTVHTHISLYESYVGLGNTQEAETVLEELKDIISEQFSDFKPFVDDILTKNNISPLFELKPFIVMGVQSCDQNNILLTTVDGEILQNFNTDMTSKGIHIETGGYDQDRLTDVIVASEIGIGNKILTFDINGQQIDEFQIDGYNEGVNIAIGNFDNNETSDIVIARQSADDRFYIYQADSSIEEIIFSDEKVKFNLAAGDINGDNNDEIILALANQKDDKNILIFNKEGNLLRSFTALLNGETQAMMVTAGDINGDSIDEIIIGQAENGYTIAIYKENGNLVNSFNTFDESLVRKKKSKVSICHKGKILQISTNALKAHLGHGDQEGQCKEKTETEDKKVTICHDSKTLQISTNVLKAHLSHGDQEGQCKEKKETEDKKVTICHDSKTLQISTNALKAHLGHGDQEGQCEEKKKIEDKKVIICHDSNKTLQISTNALKAHLSHGDQEGLCKVENRKATICHIPSGNPNNAKTISISESALGIHMSHGDKIGKCNIVTCSLYKRSGLILASGDVDNDGQLEIIVSKAGSNETRLYTSEGNLVGNFEINLSNFIITDIDFGIKQ